MTEGVEAGAPCECEARGLEMRVVSVLVVQDVMCAGTTAVMGICVMIGELAELRERVEVEVESVFVVKSVMVWRGTGTAAGAVGMVGAAGMAEMVVCVEIGEVEVE